MYFIATSTMDGSHFIVMPSDQSTLWIPVDENNTDYQQYLLWLAEGNVPEEWNPDAN